MTALTSEQCTAWSKNLTAKVRTKFGLSRIIKIQGSLRQGSVLSGTEFAKLMDEVAGYLQKEGLGAAYGDLLIAVLLLMDDLVIMENDRIKFHRMLFIIEEVRKRYCIRFGGSKSKIMIVNGDKDDKTEEYLLGDLLLEVTSTYKYLGEVLTDKGRMDDHVTRVSTRAQNQVCNILALQKESIMNKTKFASIRKLYTSCTIPSIVYGCEAWSNLQKEEKTLEDIQYKCLRRLFKVPDSTPKPALIAEMQVLYIEQEVDKRKLLYLYKLLQWPSHRLARATLEQQQEYYKYNNTTWASEINTKLEYYNLGTYEDIVNLTKHQWKYKVKQATQNKSKMKWTEEATKLSKLKQFCQNISNITEHNVLFKLNHQDANTIFKARTRMLPLKNNFKGNYNTQSMQCPRCNTENTVDNEKHLLEECTQTSKAHGSFGTEDMFSNKEKTLQAIATTIRTTLTEP